MPPAPPPPLRRPRRSGWRPVWGWADSVRRCGLSSGVPPGARAPGRRWPAGIDPYHAARGEWSPELGLALQRYLARSPAKILLVAMEDVLGQLEQVNLPGTVDELPNWRRKLVRDLEDWSQDPAVRALIDTLQAERPPTAPKAAAQ